MKQILIGGTGRCGTTILKRLLSLHSKIVSIPVELRVIADPGGALDLIQAVSDSWSPYNADVALQRFRSLMIECGRARFRVTNFIQKVEKKIFWSLGATSRRYLGMGFSNIFGKKFYYERIESLVNQISHHISRGCHDASPPYKFRSKIYEVDPKERREVCGIISSFFNDLYHQLISNAEQNYWIDDTPYNLVRAHELLNLFPDMRFIHIYRDPRDVAASHLRFKWGGDEIRAVAIRLENIYKRWFEIRSNLPSDSYMEISLEELVRSPEKLLRGVCDFIGIEYESSLKSSLIRPTNIGRWKREIPPEDWGSIGERLVRALIEYDYDVIPR
jgi:hypothetical protein